MSISINFLSQHSDWNAYFSMEFAIDQSLKIYSGGLGFLAGSHVRSAFELNLPLLGVGMLWKYGYYDQVRTKEGFMGTAEIEKKYSFLEDCGATVEILIHDHIVHVRGFWLAPNIFKTAPILLLSTDIEENDALSRTITHRLYDANVATRIAQSMVLGKAGVLLLEKLDLKIKTYHLNEGHAVPLCFQLLEKEKDINKVKNKIVFTTHTPEKAGNEEHDVALLQEMSFFGQCTPEMIEPFLKKPENVLDYTLAALRFAKKANAVSQLHWKVAVDMWQSYEGICPIIDITNAQNGTYWKDITLSKAFKEGNSSAFFERKKELKKELIAEVADQTGKLFSEDTLTIVWARRFAGYKRADLILRDFERFEAIARNTEKPIQMIWAGKPFPLDNSGIGIFNSIIDRVKDLPNCAVLVGYELKLSAILKKGSDVWLNTPTLYREASGTSGMTAAMNGSLNVSIPDGWVPEFAKDGENSWIIQPANDQNQTFERDRQESARLYELLEQKVLPTYYNQRELWFKMLQTAHKDVLRTFESGRMVEEYEDKMYV